MAEVVKSAQITISEVWPDHVVHKTVGKAPRWDSEQGVICACGVVLGWPDPENRETLSQYTKRVAQEQVDTAIAEGKISRGTAKVKGAFGEYAAQEQAQPSTQDHPDGDLQPSTSDEPRRWPVGATDNPVDVREPGDYPDPEVQEPPRHGDDPGPAEPPELDWDEPPDDEPEPERLTISDGAGQDQAVRDAVRSTGVRSMREVALPATIEDGDSEDAGSAPFPADAVPDDRGNMISGGESYGKPSGPVDFGRLVDEVTEPETVFEADADRYPDEAQASPLVFVGKHVTGIAPPDDDAWPEEGKRAFAEAVVRGNPSNEGIQEEPEVGRDLVPFAGTPLMPTDPDSMDPLNRALPPLDPTLPYTPADVELKILEVLQQGERGERFLREQLARLHQAQHNLDLRYNLAIAKSDARAADQRKAEAWIVTEKERFEATQAEMLVRALRDNLHNLRAQLSGFQSVARSLGVSLTNALDGRDAPRRVESHREPPPVAPWEYQ